MVSKKDRRHNGWVTSKLNIKANRQFILDNCLEPQPFWDDWGERRDGMRDWFSDGKLIKKKHDLHDDPGEYETKRIKRNNKQKKLLKIRKAMKQRGYGVMV